MDIARRLPSWPAPPWHATPWRAHSRNPFSGVRAADALLAFGLTVAFSEPGFDPYHHYSGTLWAAIGALGAAALAWRQVSPRRVWLIATAASTWVLVTRHGPDWGGLSPLVLIPASLVALYTIASLTTKTTGQLAMAVSAIALESGLLSHRTQPEAVATTAALILAVWAIGEGARARREGITALADRARALEAERSQRDLLAAAEERARIARELHDIVAHHVSVISLQAGTARLLAESGAPADAALLGGIETASR
jgi:signal transduction histidine kinase